MNVTVVTSDMSFDSDTSGSLSTFEEEDPSADERPPAKVILSDRSVDYDLDEPAGGKTAPTEPTTDAAAPAASSSRAYRGAPCY